MDTRGEKQYIHMPVFAAKLYDNLTRIRGVKKGFEEIASLVNEQLKEGKLLDIGTGPGRLLKAIHMINPHMELYGLDISASMLDVANRNLQDIKNIDLQVGNIVKTDYPSDFFDCIVSSGSFYNWDHPFEGLNEIYRILKPGKTAFIFESTKSYNQELLNTRLKENLREYNFVRKYFSMYFLTKQLRRTYALHEFDSILGKCRFEKSYLIDQLELGNLPVYVRLVLSKPL